MTRAGIVLAIAATAALAGCNRKPAEEGKPPPAPAAGTPAAQAPSGLTPSALPPKRKPGLWEQSVSMAEMKQTSRICVDANVEAKMGWWGQQATKDMCSKNALTRQLDGSWRIDSECNMGSGGKTVTHGVARGDFSTAYRMDAETITTGAGAPQMNGSHKMTIEAAWKGPCPAGMKPGDLELPGGMKINMLEMASAAKK